MGCPRATESTSYKKRHGRRYTVTQLAAQVVDLRALDILGSRMDGDHNVLCILTSTKTLNTKNTREYFRWVS